MNSLFLPPADRRRSEGFTLIEVVLVLIISAILVTVALRSGITISNTARYEETKKEMEALDFAIVGNPTLQSNGARSDFGYVGDVGALPPNLDALASNPGSYSTWKGPYVRARFQQTSDDYKRDAWNVLYSYSGGTTITSTGSGQNIVRTVANSATDLLYNCVTGNVFDLQGAAPGTGYKDSITVALTMPNGSGGSTTRTLTPSASGYFRFDSVPIGNRTLKAIYRPTNDTVGSFISVTPGATTYENLHFTSSLWGTSSGLVAVAGSDTVFGAPACTDVKFWIVNNTGSPVTVTTMSVSWPSPTAYYAEIDFGSTAVFNKSGSPRGVNGTTYTLSSAQTIAAGAKVRISILDFRSTNNNGGGSPVAMGGVTLTVVLSDGSTFVEVLASCS